MEFELRRILKVSQLLTESVKTVRDFLMLNFNFNDHDYILIFCKNKSLNVITSFKNCAVDFAGSIYVKEKLLKKKAYRIIITRNMLPDFWISQRLYFYNPISHKEILIYG